MTATRDRASAVTEALRAAGEFSDSDAITDVEQLAGGWSRHSYVATAETAAGTRRFVIRVQPPATLLDTDLAIEAGLLRELERLPVPTARMYAFVDDLGSSFGGRFAVMEHVEGSAPNTYSRADQQWLADDWNGSRAIAAQVAEHLATIHSAEPSGLPDALPTLGFDAVVARWREAYETRRLVRDPVVEEAFDWVSEREPKIGWPGLVHGDYRLGNMLVEGDRIRAILDWELAYQGDVRFDLGYLSIPRQSGKHLRARSPLMCAFADRGWFMERYGQLTGRWIDDESLATFQMLGIMMLLSTQWTAVWMYAGGHTTDVRMAWARFSFAGLRQDMIELMQW
jgi:aminoglycoside phosphotransferase (APT) family kinase protein